MQRFGCAPRRHPAAGIRWSTGLFLGLALALSSPGGATAAEDRESGTEPPTFGSYGWVELGGNLMPDVGAHFSNLAQGGVFQPELKLELDPGLAVAGGLADSVTPWMAMEVQGGFLYNTIHQTTATDGGGEFPLTGNLMQSPIFVNVVLHLPGPRRFTPFIGGGLGPWLSWLDAHGTLADNEGGSVRVEGSPLEVGFGYQGFAGLRFTLAHGAFIALTYRFQGTTGTSWEFRNSSDGQSFADLKSDSIMVHSIAIGFGTVIW